LLHSCRKVFIFIQQTIAVLAKGNPEAGVKLYLEAALTADKFSGKDATGKEAFGQIAYEFISQSFALYEENSGDSKLQGRCVVAMIGTLLACRALTKEDYESLIMKAATYSAKMLKKSDQCEMVALCSHLFYVVGEGVSTREVKSCSFERVSNDTCGYLKPCSGCGNLQQPTTWTGMFKAGVEVGRRMYKCESS